MGDTEQEKQAREEFCGRLRGAIEELKIEIAVETTGHERHCNTTTASALVFGREDAENLVLAYRHLEDARMRLGKAMQALQGGVSILDRKPDAPQEGAST